MTDRNCISRAGTTRNRKARLFPAAQVTSSTHHETCTTRTVESEQMHSFPGEVIPKHSALCGQGRLCTVSHLTFRINISESVSSIYLPLSPANDLPKVTMGMSGHSVLNPETWTPAKCSSQIPGVAPMVRNPGQCLLPWLLGASKHSSCSGFPRTKDFPGNESPWNKLNY